MLSQMGCRGQFVTRALAAGAMVWMTGAQAGCSGTIEEPSGAPATGSLGAHVGDAGAESTPSCRSSSARRLRRLSTREYLNVVTDVFGPEFATDARPMLPVEARHAGFDNQDSALLVSPVFQEAVAAVAEKLSAKVDPDQLAPCDTPDDSATCLERFARSTARKLYGRSPEPDELERLLSAAQSGEDYPTSVRLVVEVLLQSPHTLYASELGPLSGEAPTRDDVDLTQHELASQLSLLLTAARPDEELLAAADSGLLSNRRELRDQVDRLLATPRAREQLRLFVAGWLNMGPVAEAPKDPQVFPLFTPELAAAMQEELDTFIDEKVADGQGDFAGLLSDVSTHIPQALLPIYEGNLLPDTDVPTLDPNRRRGVLSLPAVLTYHSADHHSGPIERGLLVRRQLLCQSVPPPPESVLQRIAAMPPNTRDGARTTRQTYEAHVSEEFCHVCHGQFDPIGFGLEEMDGVGHYRTLEHDLPVDSSGELTSTDVDGTFVGVAELSAKLAQSSMLQTCLARHFFRFATSRPPEGDELCLAEAWGKSFTEHGSQLRELILSYVTSRDFALRKDDRE
jgi:hypothetical protein